MNATPLIPDVDDPYALFGRWFAEALAAESGLAEAMSLATATRDGKPSVRMVLLKDAGPQGFVFYTNTESRKGDEIAQNPYAALCFHWKSLNRQVRIEGKLSFVTSEEADVYWQSRPRESQIAAWASDQSRPMTGRKVLQERVQDAEARFAGEAVPRPAQWTGYRLDPSAIEFWHDVRNRLHERLEFHREGAGWRTQRLYP